MTSSSRNVTQHVASIEPRIHEPMHKPKQSKAKSDNTPTIAQIGTATKKVAKKTAVAVVKGSVAAIHIMIAAHELHQAYEWLHPIWAQAMQQFSRQGDDWIAQIKKSADAQEQYGLLKQQMMRADLYMAVIQKTFQTATQLVEEHGPLNPAQAESFGNALLEGMYQDCHPDTQEQSSAIVFHAQLSALLPARGILRRPRPF